MSEPILNTAPGQPLCVHFTSPSKEHLKGDYSCRCRAGMPYETWVQDPERWPCRRRHLLGLQQHTCANAEYPSDLSADVDQQMDKMIRDALNKPS